MLIKTVTKFDIGQKVIITYPKTYLDLHASDQLKEIADKVCRIKSIMVEKLEFTKEDYYLISYLLEDIDNVGYEHDDYVWVPECSVENYHSTRLLNDSTRDKSSQ